MYLSDIRQALQYIRNKLYIISTETQGNILIGVSGYVACGKSRLSHKLLPDVAAILHREVVYLPFDLWINSTELTSPVYAQRFLLNDFIQAIKCIQQNESFLVPRYDIVKRFGLRDVDPSPTEQIIWNRKTFISHSQKDKEQHLHELDKLFIEKKSGYTYSFYPPTDNKIYIIDGTMIFAKEIVNEYHLKIFVNAPWSLRIARMIRRFNRKEVFGLTSLSLNDYVGFLVKEAKDCADKEIYQQLTDDIIMVESLPENLSNYLDLAYLCDDEGQSDIQDWLNRDEAKKVMEIFLECLKNEKDASIVEQFRNELLTIIECKHLLKLSSTDHLLSELTEILV